MGIGWIWSMQKEDEEKETTEQARATDACYCELNLVLS
jgi:hypothetical protein